MAAINSQNISAAALSSQQKLTNTLIFNIGGKYK